MQKKYSKILLAMVFVFCLVNPVWAGEKEDSFKEIIGLLQQKYVDKVDTEKLYAGAIKGMLQSLNDPYTVYFDTYGYKNFLQGFESNFGGIGVQIINDKNGIKIDRVFKNSPAQKIGLKAGDFIINVDNKSLAKKSSSYAADLIRGKEGTKVQIQIKRATKKLSFTVKRAIIENPSVEYSMHGKFGYISINEFKDDTAKKTAQALKYFDSQKATALILDLRDNPGGELNAAIDICGMLLPSGPVIQIVDSEGKKTVINTEGKGYGKPIAVLINGNSASASEIVAGALQDRKAAILIGQKSFGKASVQSIIPLKSAGGIKMTIAHYLTPKGRYIHGKGIEPDVHVKDAFALAKAVKLLKIKK